uniref:Putative glycosyltransferase n=1 Tax=Streptococcus suis TaxID=1307 RepID=M1VKD2_STRSU|nr:putative glycosyltransferase [Streptococcus suis]
MNNLVNIEIICPLYNAENYIETFNNSLQMQKNVNIQKIHYILTESNDNSENFLIDNNLFYTKISKKEFSHSLVRERAAMASDSDVVVFVTQDVEIVNDDWLYKLTSCLNNEIVASYSRQLTKFDNIEKYTREKNYPEISRIVSARDIEELGLNTFFFSDASSAIRTDVFKMLNGYDGKNLPTNEDMYFAHKLITNGYSIKYCAESVVYHSHDFSLKEIYDRYWLTGKFFKENSYLNEYGTNSSGAELAIYILKRIFEEKRFGLLFRFPFDMAARFLGMKAGMR